MNIVLIGFMGTGKSAVGRVLARRLGWRHIDTDAEIEREAGRIIPEIFRDEGEAAADIDKAHDWMTAFTGDLYADV